MLDFKGNPDILKPPNANEAIEIVGVAATMRNRGLTSPSRARRLRPMDRSGAALRRNSDSHFGQSE